MRAPFLLPTASQAPGPFRDPRLPLLRGTGARTQGSWCIHRKVPVRGNRLTKQHSFPSFLWLRLNITVLLSSGVGWEREGGGEEGGGEGRGVCFCCPAAP